MVRIMSDFLGNLPFLEHNRCRPIDYVAGVLSSIYTACVIYP